MDLIERAEFSQKILEYYDVHRRVLPWREDPRPYYVWLSEIMLQQTRVETVLPYFARFIETLPDVRSLAEVPEEKLLKLWEGLGYYSRARNLRKAAKIIVSDFGGELPPSKKQLLSLPGIGAYTAGAISSIAFGKKETAVDGNLIRVGSRILAYEGPTGKAEGKKAMEDFWESVLPEKRAGDFNQAVMDIGARICIPSGAPKCSDCPVSSHCRGFQTGSQTAYPVKEEKKQRRIEEKTIFILYQGEEIAFEKRKNQGLLAGLWQFPMEEGRLEEEEALKKLQKKGYRPLRIVKGPAAKHIFSHIEWKMVSWKVMLDPFLVREAENAEEGALWLPAERIDEIAIASAFRRFREEVLKKKGKRRFEE